MLPDPVKRVCCPAIMDARRAVDDFLYLGKGLFHILHDGSQELTDLELQLLRSQLHLLEIKVTNIQTLRQLRTKDGETAAYLERLRRGDQAAIAAASPRPPRCPNSPTRS